MRIKVFLQLVSIAIFSTHALAVPPTFTDATSLAGITPLPTGTSINNTMSGGIAWIDYNNDNWQDLFVVNTSKGLSGGAVDETAPNQLFRNNGNGQFAEITAALAGFALPNVKSIGIAVGDYDKDGFDDIFIATNGQNVLLRNLGGSGNFADVTVQANLHVERKLNFGAAFGDVDGDGDLDLYVSTWTGSDGSENDLYLNNGDASFSKAPASVGVDNPGSGFVSVFTDYDNDRDLDLFVTNDIFFSTPNELYRNDGNNALGLPVLTPVGAEVGVGQASLAMMGLATGDYDNDGDLDYYRTKNGNGILSTNTGSAGFLSSELVSIGTRGWGAVFFDANNDGYLDLYRGNSSSGFGGGTQPNDFFLNNGNGGFSLASNAADLISAPDGRYYGGLGVAVADYDNDGDVDIVTHDVDGQIDLIRNDTVTADDWLQIRLKGQPVNHRAIGAKVRVTSVSPAGTLKQLREVHSGESHGSVSAFPVHFGFPDGSTISELTVEWPRGRDTVLANVTTNQAVNISELERVAGINFLDMADSVSASTGAYRTNSLTPGVGAVADGNGASYIYSTDAIATFDVAFGSLPNDSAFDVADVDFTFLFVGDGEHFGTVTLLGGSLNGSSVDFSVVASSENYTGFNARQGNAVYGIFSEPRILGDSFIGTFTGVRVDISNASAVPSLIGSRL